AGASGAIGRALIPRLRANQHEVIALTQSRDSAAVLKEFGAEPVIADALDAAAVKAAVGEIRPNAVINELTSLPRHFRSTQTSPRNYPGSWSQREPKRAKGDDANELEAVALLPVHRGKTRMPSG